MKRLIFIFVCITSVAKADFYPENYEQSRKKFLTLLEKYPQAKVFSKKIENPQDFNDDLTIDYAYIPAQEKFRKLLIINSGVHGAEAFVGAAAQHYFLTEVYPQLGPHVGVILFHAVNPYGFKYNRRVNENNVDLNRNFGDGPEFFQKKNTGYNDIRNILNPEKSVGEPLLSLVKTAFGLLWKLAFGDFTKEDIRKATATGQYEHSKGVFFGGQKLQDATILFDLFLPQYFSQYQKLLLLDFHTGLGEDEQLHLITGVNTSEDEIQTIQKIFDESGSSNYVVTFPEDEGFYPVSGDVIDFVQKQAKKSGMNEVIALTAEFGTMGISTLGQLKTINRMILENQGHHYGFKSEQIKDKVKAEFKDHFFPTRNSWRVEVQRKIENLFNGPVVRYLE